MRIKLSRFAIPFVLWIAVAVQPIELAQALTKVTMTTGSFSEREAAMYDQVRHVREMSVGGRRQVAIMPSRDAPR